MELDRICKKSAAGEEIAREEAFFLSRCDLNRLCRAADGMRRQQSGDRFDLCAVVNVRGGRCSEDCRFCAQNRRAHTEIDTFRLIDRNSLLEDGLRRYHQGVRHYGFVSSGRQMPDELLNELCVQIAELHRLAPGLRLCASLGLLNRSQMERLKAAGVTRLHNNLETSRRYFPALCTSHRYEDKLRVIRDAKAVGLEVCTGGIIGVGETMEDRIDLALTLRRIGVDSVPINILHPIRGTDFEGQSGVSGADAERTIALFRILLPGAQIRLAAGRDFLPDSGYYCFSCGADAAITGDMLTVHGMTVEKDVETLKKMGYQLKF